MTTSSAQTEPTELTGPTEATGPTELRRTVETYWAAAEARDWDAVASTLADDVVYDLPQTRERISGKEKYLRFNREYPGDWHARIERVVADGDQAVTWIRVTVGLEEMYAIAFFTGDGQGRIKAHVDFWPEPYEPPLGREHLVERY
ncbi:nuclear transport factor 2 family protein [Streptomyces apocyni]|uniref:nuclear transport factor 2 family protein n=1 Tax=Streptomyces apocyni TaxID=2654677 RepID=UPI0012EA8DA0|nr:nuclear transport factor 2 family protein [Streptomyces apocyni]